jgi:hypothetical protein
MDYTDGSCGGPTDAELDHSGRYVYVLLQGTCAFYQSYMINNDNSFTFDGGTQVNAPAGQTAGFGLPSILGNESFAYANEWVDHYSNLNGFRRQNSGTLELMQFGETDPTLPPPCSVCTGQYLPAYPDASPTGNYVVVQLYPNDGSGDSGRPQLGSYTVDSSGNISTTNTSTNMPTSALEPSDSAFSPSGNLFVLGGDAMDGVGEPGNGIEIYNFDGANPLTLYKKLLTGTPIDQVAWDSSNHLYAISYAANKLYVFTVTSTSVTQDSTVSIGSPFKLVVVSQAATGGGSCSVPSTGGINVCAPDENASVTSPVAINAAASISGGIYRFSLWNGSTKLLSEDNGIMNDTVSLAPGTYHLIFDARNSSGVHEYAKRDITVTGGGACPAPSSNGINVCSPAEGATVSSPVAISATATISGGIYRFSLWNGNTKLLSEDNGTMNGSVSLPAGTYKLTFDARNTAGNHYYATRNITVQ